MKRLELARACALPDVGSVLDTRKETTLVEPGFARVLERTCEMATGTVIILFALIAASDLPWRRSHTNASGVAQ